MIRLPSPRFLPLVCVLLTLCPSLVRAAVSREFSDTYGSMEITFPNGYQAHYGFHPVRFVAVNKGTKNQTWRITIQQRYGQSDTLNQRGLSQKIVVPAGQTIEAESLIPIGKSSFEQHWMGLEVTVVAPSGTLPSWSVGDYGSGSIDRSQSSLPVLLTDRAAEQSKSAPPEDDQMHGRLDPLRASTDWRGYTAYSVVVLTPDDWQSMSPSTRAALGDWVRMGGQLQFVGGLPNDAPATDVPGETGRGLGGVHQETTKTVFAQLGGVKAAKQQSSPSMYAIANAGAWLEPWLKKQGRDLIEGRFVIWPMVFVLIVFFIIITPLNLFVLAPTRNRHRLFRTIPLISLSACVILAVAVVLGDGIGGKGQRWVWIESRGGEENRLSITQWQASRCMAVAGTTFTVNDAAYLAPLRAPGSSVSLQAMGDKLEGSGGWFTSRSTQSHLLQSMRSGRGRIEWTDSDSAPIAVSTFDFPLRDVLVPIDQTSWWHAASLDQGKPTSFRKISSGEAHAIIQKTLDSRPMAKQARELAHRAHHFFAFTEKPPAIETLDAIRWQDSGIVTGVLVASK